VLTCHFTVVTEDKIHRLLSFVKNKVLNFVEAINI